jgi:hypothetical protein
MVGPGGRIDTAGFVASTLNISNADFLAGRKLFDNDGRRRTSSTRAKSAPRAGGSVYLIGSNVTNEGLISTPKAKPSWPPGSHRQPGRQRHAGRQGRHHRGGGQRHQPRADHGGRRTHRHRRRHRQEQRHTQCQQRRQRRRAHLPQGQPGRLVDGNGRIVTTGTKGGKVEVLGNRVAVMDKAEIDASGKGRRHDPGRRRLPGQEPEVRTPTSATSARMPRTEGRRHGSRRWRHGDRLGRRHDAGLRHDLGARRRQRWRRRLRRNLGQRSGCCRRPGGYPRTRWKDRRLAA